MESQVVFIKDEVTPDILRAFLRVWLWSSRTHVAL